MEIEWFDEFYAEGLISEVLAQLKSGKEATVFVCRPGPAPEASPNGTNLLAVKSYCSRLGRGFQNRSSYTQGRFWGGTRDTRAVANKSRFGHQVSEALWVGHEFDMLCRLHFAGADVPQPIAATGSAILMQFVGDESGPAQQLREIRPAAGDARTLLERLISNIECMLANNVVHGDLSAYNVLVHNGRPVIIDLPQAVDARANGNARELLRRDLNSICQHFERFGARANADRISEGLWQRFMRAELRTGPAAA